MTDFVVHALQMAAFRAIAESDQLRLSVVDQEAFAKALIAPAKPNAALKRAFPKPTGFWWPKRLDLAH